MTIWQIRNSEIFCFAKCFVAQTEKKMASFTFHEQKQLHFASMLLKGWCPSTYLKDMAIFFRGTIKVPMGQLFPPESHSVTLQAVPATNLDSKSLSKIFGDQIRPKLLSWISLQCYLMYVLPNWGSFSIQHQGLS